MIRFSAHLWNPSRLSEGHQTLQTLNVLPTDFVVEYYWNEGITLPRESEGGKKRREKRFREAKTEL